MNIYVIGIGRIGLVTACCLADAGHRVTGVEIDNDKLGKLNEGLNPILEEGIDILLKKTLAKETLKFVNAIPAGLKADAVILTVNTPPLPDGNLDLKQIYNVMNRVVESAASPLLVIMKSTVPPGTGRQIIERFLKGTQHTYVSNPEFLSEGKAVNDWYHPSRIVIGCEDISHLDEIREIYTGIEGEWVITDIVTAEIIKAASNAFLATKISFINEIADICENVGANVDDVAAGMGLDKRIGNSFLKAGLGFGGPCLYKDTRMLGNMARRKDRKADSVLIRAVINVNSNRTAQVIEKLKRHLHPLKGSNIGLLGITFKPDTNDITNSPALEIAGRLIKQGASLKLYDPAFNDSDAPVFRHARLKVVKDIYEAASSVNAIVLSTEWKEFIGADWPLIKQSMLPPYLIIDGRNALPQQKLINLGFKYVGMGRKLV